MDILKANQRAWDRIGEQTASPYEGHPQYQQFFADFCRKLPQGACVLDVGCGPGIPFTKRLADRGFAVTAVDLSENMVKAARKNVPEAECKQISMTKIQFEEAFDGVFSGHSMLCLDPAKFKIAAGRIMRALKQNGWMFLALNEPGPEGHDERESHTEIMGEEMYSRPYTEGEVREAFDGMRFSSVERVVVYSEEYGEEYALLVLMQKP